MRGEEETLSWLASLKTWGKNTAIYDNGRIVSYLELSDLIDANYLRLKALTESESNKSAVTTNLDRPLVMLNMGNSLVSVVHYLTCLSAGWPVILINPKLSNDATNSLLKDYRPNFLLRESQIDVLSLTQHNIAQSLAVIMMTSGSTGGGKGVALSASNIEANTNSICQFLPINSSDIALASMPLSYSYGLSILHTHLAKGACTALTSFTVMDREFWTLLEALPVTSLAGVPHWYDMLIRLRFTRRHLPHLRYFTQAGGRISENIAKALSEFSEKNASPFYRMYGQTEATARIAWLPPELAGVKLDSIGKAIPGGELCLKDETGQVIKGAGVEGELHFKGENCMLGYVNNIDQCASFSPLTSLATGDIAKRDEDGDYMIVGRIKRIIKLLGERINLDGLEAMFCSKQLDVKCCGNDSVLYICCQPDNKANVDAQCEVLLSIPPSYFKVVSVAQWPLLHNGKTDYVALQKQVEGILNDTP